MERFGDEEHAVPLDPLARLRQSSGPRNGREAWRWFTKRRVLTIASILFFLGVMAALMTAIQLRVPHREPVEPVVPDIPLRLPGTVVPLRYRLFIEPDFAKFTFAGTVEIDVELAESMSEIWLHSLDLQITRAVIASAGDSSFSPAVNVTYNRTLEFVFLNFSGLPDMFAAGSRQFVLALDFNGELTETMYGFYRSNYTIGSTSHWLAATQFEATAAREAFPCFDEPQYKANFTITVGSDAEHTTVLSNMPERSRTAVDAAGRFRVSFEESVPMSTYLVAFIVSDYVYIEQELPGTLLRLCASPAFVEQGRYALSVAAKALVFYNDYFGIKFPLPKLDFVALPDFHAGAMENWGLITFRESMLLFDNVTSSTLDMQVIAATVCHEIAHQWFGNLVTMLWWDDVWLNEGFATYMEYLGMQAAEPSWDIIDQRLMDQRAALQADSVGSTHALYQSASTPGEISELFDDISYSKGSMVLFMLQTYLDAKKPGSFAIGVRNYLSKHAYGSATHIDLWEALAESSGEPIVATLSPWTLNAGYPVISITTDSSGRVVATQDSVLPKSDKTWWVPLSLQTGSAAQAVVQVSLDGLQTTTSTAHAAGQYIVANVRHAGFYRVLYTPEMRASTLALLTTDVSALTPLDLAGELDDLFNLAWGSYRNTTVLPFMDLSKVLKQSRSLLPWSHGLNGLRRLDRLVALHPAKFVLQHHILDLLDPILGVVGWNVLPTDSHELCLLRSLVLVAAIRYQHPAATQAALARFRQFRDGILVPHVDVRAALYRAAVVAGDHDDFDWLLARSRNSTLLVTERLRCLLALGDTTDHALINRVLELVLSGEVRSQDAPTLLAAVGANPHGQIAAWHFFRYNYDSFTDRYSVTYDIPDMVVSLTKWFATEEEQRDLLGFIKEHDDLDTRNIQLNLETVQMNIDFINANAPLLLSWANL